MSLIDGLLLDSAPYHVWLSTRTDSNGSGVITDPYRADTAERFDKILRDLPANVATVAHLAPGNYETGGYYDGAASNYGW